MQQRTTGRQLSLTARTKLSSSRRRCCSTLSLGQLSRANACALTIGTSEICPCDEASEHLDENTMSRSNLRNLTKEMNMQSILRTSAVAILVLSATSAASLLLATNANAQSKQTIEGAQNFLSQLAGNGRGQLTFMSGLVLRDGSKAWASEVPETWTVTEIGIGGPSDPQDACVTRISKVAAGENMPWQFKEKGFSASHNPPHYIDWRKAQISRHANGIQIIVPNATFRELRLGFTANEPEMIDRIDYAAKFLQMSCDPTVDTGF